MKEWETLCANSKDNLWLITTLKQKLLCKKINGDFYLKAPIKTLIPNHYIIKSQKI